MNYIENALIIFLFAVSELLVWLFFGYCWNRSFPNEYNLKGVRGYPFE
ncbi:hypothetical protein [Erwinia typographi]|nr:hypothetical protein [Erwinia typographi]